MSNSDPCPFCGFKPGQGEYELILHIEQQHPDADSSPLTTSGDPISCPEGCGEILQLDELAYHLELHELEAQDATPEPEPEQTPTVARKPEPSTRERERKHKKREDAGITKTTSRGSSSRDKNGERAKSNVRLGKSDLGRFAHERKMPPWLVDLLKDEGQVVNDGVMPVLSQLLEQSPSTQYAYLCHPAVQHVSKLRREGGFCGYRNIQMLTSNIISAQREGSNHFGRTFPSIFQIQDLIENAWDMGINAQGRAETGGVKGTRKYIGTPEAQAVFLSLEIPCSVQAFKDQERGKSKQRLFEAIEGYFRGGITSVEDRIHHTELPPIYLQHPGHSLTIVGFERQMDGQANLLVFDPSFRDSTKIRNLIDRTVRQKPSSIDSFLQPYRRGSHYFRKYNQYEVLYLTKYAALS
ncbi:Ubiquitin carboxyl-terminal hydrolase ZUFSP [Fusarium oxysporum f. sp. rapae]|uniref:Ubiquitin carboxyl-terminal hydrolase ZUFSP n=1 Tax=Fusarium oxysporum f. sp. rapae TaxID=485398 RepID=A0A8J5TWM3_FUSOX|nr:Ubiquitin carboxyl-terminal hydrolase ZUFSP [Fusarium oxysporum f. sp. rapae]